MKNRELLVRVFAIMLCSVLVTAQSTSESTVPSNDAIRQILVERVADRQGSVGIVVGVIEPTGRRIVSYGSAGTGTRRPMDGDTVFEIGSITKVFTSLLLADLVEQGEVTLSDPVGKFLPPEVTLPERSGRVITLEDLSTHRSGLPRLPSNLAAGENPENPYASYSVDQLYEFLSHYELPRDIGSEFEYSNLGGGLLGHVVGLYAGQEYETLVTTRIAAPLGMNDTAITLSAGLERRMARGHNSRSERVSNWDLPTLAGAGALRSTAKDMLSFLAANLGYTDSSLAPALASMVSVRGPAGPAGEMGLGWIVSTRDERQTIWHNGGTGGYRAFVGFDPGANVGVVVLTNISTAAGVDDIGHHLINAEFPLLPPESPLLQAPRERTEITIDPDLLDEYVGRYQLAPNVFFTVTREGNQLSAQLTGQGTAEIYPETERDFFYRVVDAQITFETDSQGRVNALVLHQLGRDQIAQKLDSEADPIQEWFGHTVTAVDANLFDGYVGEYQLAPAVIVTVTREGDQLFEQLTGQPRFEVFPESERDYFLKVVDAQVTFETDADGSAVALILHQGGRDQRAERVE